MINYKDMQNYDYIFFNFDTLLLKNATAEDKKKIWCNHIIKCFDLQVNMIELYSFRINKEYELYGNALSDDLNQEISYCDLIFSVFNKFGLNQYNIDYDVFEKKCMEIEINIEQNIQELNNDIISIIKKLRKNDKKIYCVSHTYSSKHMLKKILTYHKVESLFDDLYVSNQLLISNKIDELYDYILKKMNIELDKCLIIESNSILKKIPVSLDLKICSIDCTYENAFIEIYNDEEIYNKFCNITSSSNDNFEHIIFSLYNFIEKLYFELLRNDKEEVIFLSREGEFLKKLFDVYVSKIRNKKIISKYIIVSRKSTYLPSLKTIELEDFSFLLNQYSYINALEFLKSLNFNDEEISSIKKSVIDNTKFNFDDKILHFEQSDIFKNIICNSKFIEIYESKRVSQSNNFRKYIKQITSSKNISVVDIGWNGSIQSNMQKILGDSYHVDGYYLGLEKRDNIIDDNKKGLIFSNIPKLSHDYHLYSANKTIYEILLAASHGSANMYIEKNGQIEVELFAKKEEKELYNGLISKVQNNMLTIFLDLCDLFTNGFYDMKKYNKKINQIHFNMMFRPNLKQINFFNNVYHYENFGVFDFTTFNKNIKPGFLPKLKQNAKFLIKWRSYFDDCFWPILKLYNNNMKLAMFIYYNLKRIKFKTNDII